MGGVRRRRQDQARNEAVVWVVEQLFHHLESDLKRITSTNRLFPCGNLKRERLKKMFANWPSEFYGCGRVFTLKLAGVVTGRLRRRMGLDVSEFQLAEDKRLLSLLKTSRKHYVMDTAETLPMQELVYNAFYDLNKVWPKVLFFSGPPSHAATLRRIPQSMKLRRSTRQSRSSRSQSLRFFGTLSRVRSETQTENGPDEEESMPQHAFGTL